MNKVPGKSPATDGLSLNRLAQMDAPASSRMQDLLNRESDFEEYRARTEQALKKREKDLQNDAERRQQSIEYHEQKSLEMQIQLERKLDSISNENERIRAEFVKKEADFAQKSEELEQEKQKYTEERQASLRERSETYVTKALTSLKIKDDTFHKYSLQWGMAGAAVIALAFILVVVVSFVPYFSPNNSSLKGWEYIVYASLRGLVTIGVALAFSRYAFLFSKQYMQQSLKIADRRHAISFGAFYIDSYGAAANWSEVKEAFVNWNLSGVDSTDEGGHKKLQESLPDVGDLTKRLGAVLSDLKEITKTIKE